MSQLSVDGEKVLRFQHERITKALFKKFLVILEDLEREHDTSMNKLYNKLPEEYKVFVELADYLDEEKASILRSKVLGAGNDTLRELEELVKQFNITIK